jgi:hypothetical protein
MEIRKPWFSSSETISSPPFHRWSPTVEGLFLYYPGHRQVPATLRALIDMIRCARSKPGKGLLKNPFTKV